MVPIIRRSYCSKFSIAVEFIARGGGKGNIYVHWQMRSDFDFESCFENLGVHSITASISWQKILTMLHFSSAIYFLKLWMHRLTHILSDRIKASIVQKNTQLLD